jgi:hypothetical protein
VVGGEAGRGSRQAKREKEVVGGGVVRSCGDGRKTEET